MKIKNVSRIIGFLAGIYVCIGSGHLNAQNIGMNSAGTLPNPKALLDIDVSSNGNKMGLLVPRMTTAERNTITAPIPESLLLYNTTTQCFEAWNQTANVWVPFGCIGCALPVTPGALAATNTTTNSLSANWSAATGATSYLLDVSISSTFASFVSGYNGLNVGSALTSAVSGLACGSTYYYRVRATNACGTSISSNTITAATATCCATPGAPIANAATGINTNSFTANWNTVSGATAYLLDVSTSPSFASFVSGFNGLNVGNVLTSSVNTLTCSTTYYYRVRATSACGTGANSNTIALVTATCPVITPTIPACGTQIWAAFNMDVGTMINVNTSSTNNSVVEKYCFNDIPANCTTYGGFYQWDEAMNYASSVNCDPCGSTGVQGICPTGFHVPTDLEWSRYEFCLESTIAPTATVTLSDFQTGTAYRGTNTGEKLKATASNTPAWDGTNASGFNALLTGYMAGGVYGNNVPLGGNTMFWTATDQGTYAWSRRLGNNIIQSGRFLPMGDKSSGFSVRCLQD